MADYVETLEDRVFAARLVIDSLKAENERLAREAVKMAERILELEDELEAKDKKLSDLKDNVINFELGATSIIKMDGF